MFPVPLSECFYVDISKEKDEHYRALLLSEYRYIKSIQEKIRKNASNVYKHKIEHGNSTGLAKDVMILFSWNVFAGNIKIK